jgi:hypothetical protein
VIVAHSFRKVLEMMRGGSNRLQLGCVSLATFVLACSSNEPSSPQNSSGGNENVAGGNSVAPSASGMAGKGGSGGGPASSVAGASASGGASDVGHGGMSSTTGGMNGGVAGAGHAGGTPAGVSGAGGTGTAGSSAGAGSGLAGSGPTGNCQFTVKAQTADKAGQNGVPTVGVVDWSVNLPSITKASISFGVQAGTTTLTAPVDVMTGPNFHTLLLGMKASKTYSFKITADACTSDAYTITTGALPNAVAHVTRTAGPAASSQAKGFIVTSSGPGSLSAGIGAGNTSAYAYIIDADGDIVWWAPAPVSCSRAKMSYDGQYMWMAELNVDNATKNGGEIRRVSMDGLANTGSIAGLANCHHDLTVLPDGKIACLSWIQQSGDQPSDLLESDYQGNVKKVMTLDSKVYAGGTGLGGGSGTYHANSIHYHDYDDSYTISDRNPNLFIKVTRAGVLKWQFGGSCTNAPAPQCVAGDWKVNHGHDMLEDGTFLIFNNGQSGASAALFYKLTEAGTLSATKTGQYAPGTTSSVLGDVQRLPNGNTLVTFSIAGTMDEIDASGSVVQHISGPGGYAEWRETLYGPPPRF